MMMEVTVMIIRTASTTTTQMVFFSLLPFPKFGLCLKIKIKVALTPKEKMMNMFMNTTLHQMAEMGGSEPTIEKKIMSNSPFIISNNSFSLLGHPKFFQ